MIEYIAAILAIILAAAALWDAFYVDKGRTRRLVMSFILLATTAFTVISIHRADKAHEGDAGQIKALRDAVDKATKTQQTNATTFSTAQEAARTQFLEQFNKMSQRVADLQTGIKTANLQKEADQLRADLKATQKALAPTPKINLLLSLSGFDKNSGKPVLRTSLPANNNIVHVDIEIANPTEIGAQMGFIALFVCNSCKFAKEPKDFVHVPKSPETQRNLEFPAFYAKTVTNFSLDVVIPASATSFVIGMQYHCGNCVNDNVQTVTVDVTH